MSAAAFFQNTLAEYLLCLRYCAGTRDTKQNDRVCPQGAHSPVVKRRTPPFLSQRLLALCTAGTRGEMLALLLPDSESQQSREGGESTHNRPPTPCALNKHLASTLCNKLGE